MSRARGALCRACLALAAALAALLLLPLPRAPAPARAPTSTPAPPARAPRLRPDDVFIAVKTTRRNHGPRLRLLLRTWISRARPQVRPPPRPPTRGPFLRSGLGVRSRRTPGEAGFGWPGLEPAPLSRGTRLGGPPAAPPSQRVSPQTFIFTDGDDPDLRLQAGESPAPARGHRVPLQRAERCHLLRVTGGQGAASRPPAPTGQVGPSSGPFPGGRPRVGCRVAPPGH